MSATRHRAGVLLARLLIAAGVALTLADASIVTLGLPEILTRLETSVSGVAAVIGVYTVVLAVGLPAAVPLRRRLGSAPLAAAGLAVFALASVACGASDSLAGLLAGRAAQAIGAAAALVGGFALLARDRSAGPDRLWVAAAVFGTAVGPPLGGALTELFDWRAIFLAQAPIALLAALGSLAPLPTAPPTAEAVPDDAPADRWPIPPDRPGPSDARPAGSDAPTRIVGGASGEDAPTRDGGRAGPPRPGASQNGDPATDRPDDADVPTAPATRPTLPRPRPAATGARTIHRRSDREAAPRTRRPTGPSAPVTVGDDVPPDPSPPLDRWRAGAALALVSAALTAVIFLLVLLLVTGWSVRPLRAAIGVSVLPLAALVGTRVPGDPWLRACAGSGLVGAGVLALATLPTVGAGWVVLPQLAAGVGMGMALPALAGELLPERSPREAARLLTLRHVGITVALLILAPVTAAQLDTTIDRTRDQVVALLLDARLPPQPKLEAVGPALAEVDVEDPRGALRTALDGEAHRFAGDADQAAVYAEMTQRADDTLVAAINEAFRPAFLITGALALLAALLVLPVPARHPTLAVAVIGVGLAAAGGQALMAEGARPPAVVIRDPCEDRRLPSSGGISGFVQDTALSGLDNAACRWGSTREELALAIADPDLARAYRERHGHDPRSPLELLRGALEGGDGGFGELVRNVLGGG